MVVDQLSRVDGGRPDQSGRWPSVLVGVWSTSAYDKHSIVCSINSIFDWNSQHHYNPSTQVLQRSLASGNRVNHRTQHRGGSPVSGDALPCRRLSKISVSRQLLTWKVTSFFVHLHWFLHSLPCYQTLPLIEALDNSCGLLRFRQIHRRHGGVLGCRGALYRLRASTEHTTKEC